MLEKIKINEKDFPLQIQPYFRGGHIYDSSSHSQAKV